RLRKALGDQPEVTSSRGKRRMSRRLQQNYRNRGRSGRRNRYGSLDVLRADIGGDRQHKHQRGERDDEPHRTLPSSVRSPPASVRTSSWSKYSARASTDSGTRASYNLRARAISPWRRDIRSPDRRPASTMGS